MKRQYQLLFAIAVFATALTINVSGQTARMATANVKFDFQIGDRVYPAGQYRIGLTSAQSDNILLISNVCDTNKSQIILVRSSTKGKSQTPKLAFLKDGDRYFLTEVFLDSGQWGYSILQSRPQHESEKSLTSRVSRKN